MTDSNIDKIFDLVDKLMYQNDIESIDLIMQFLDLTIDIDYLLGFLTISLPIKSKLKNRKRLINHIKLTRLDYKELLGGLE